MRSLGTLPAGMRRYRWSWPVCGALLLTGSSLVWGFIGRLLAWCLR